MSARLPKRNPCCKALVAALAALLSMGAVAIEPQGATDSELRACVAKARDPQAINACELLARPRLAESVESLSRQVATRLDARQRAVFERNTQAWRAFLETELAMLELTLGQRRDGLGAMLHPGSINRLYESRIQQLREHLHNLR